MYLRLSNVAACRAGYLLKEYMQDFLIFFDRSALPAYRCFLTFRKASLLLGGSEGPLKPSKTLVLVTIYLLTKLS